MEGITDAVYRRVHHELFPGVDKYFMPFISPSSSVSFTQQERFNLSPAQNSGVCAVPQILAKDPSCFLGAALMLRDLGYGEVNLNLGCPSGTVMGKGKGAAMLRDLDALARFLDGICLKSPLPVSLKTRIGCESPDEWHSLLRLFCRYPVTELILHPRTAREQYSGSPHPEALEEALREAPFPVVYNGDLFSPEACRSLSRKHPELRALMAGRGPAANPALFREASGGAALCMEDLSRFHDRLFREYLRCWPQTAVVTRLYALMTYMIRTVDCPPPLLRRLRRASAPDAYTDTVSEIFTTCRLRREPCFQP